MQGCGTVTGTRESKQASSWCKWPPSSSEKTSHQVGDNHCQTPASLLLRWGKGLCIFCFSWLCWEYLGFHLAERGYSWASKEYLRLVKLAAVWGVSPLHIGMLLSRVWVMTAGQSTISISENLHLAPGWMGVCPYYQAQGKQIYESTSENFCSSEKVYHFVRNRSSSISFSDSPQRHQLQHTPAQLLPDEISLNIIWKLM